MRILLVEDDHRIADPVAEALRRQRHLVDLATDGTTGLALCERDAHEMVLLDIGLPGVSGVEICAALRRRGSRALVMMMTARDAVSDKVRTLDLGADDYLVKPFALDELLARVRALSRRSPGARTLLRHGALEIDSAGAEVRWNGQPVALTRTEFELLATFMRHPTRVFSAASLYDRIAPLHAEGSPNAVKTHLTNLRRKLRRAGMPGNPLVAVYGFGYRLADG